MATDDRHTLPSPEDAAVALAALADALVQIEPSKASAVASGEGQRAPPDPLELRYLHLVEQIPAVVFTAALDGGLHDVYVGPQIEELLGYSQAEWSANPVLWHERLHPDDRGRLIEEFARGCREGGSFRAECRFLARDGHIVWVHGEARLIADARGMPVLLQGVAFDITESKRAEEVVRASLREKETLLKEIHHRVKNNLQITSSLLRLQADRTRDPEAYAGLRESEDRIRSMALVHELLYRSDDLSHIDLAQYIHVVTEKLYRGHGSDPHRIHLELALDHVWVSVDLAVPCGLLLNEVVSNALRHAFPGDRRGTIHVELRATDGRVDLVIRDDGVGLPDEVILRTNKSLGMRLVRTLAAQIDAQLDVHSDGGTQIRVCIPQPGGDRNAG